VARQVTVSLHNVHKTAELLTVSPDTVYDLFKRGELPGRKVGRKWLTVRCAVLHWIKSTSQEDTLTRAIEQVDAQALAEALKNGQIQVNKRA
jgi:excisionase family DNA binding protein